MTLPGFDDVTTLLKARLQAEVDGGFPKLSRIPSSGAIRFLDCFSSFAPGLQSALVDSHARLAAMTFLPAAMTRDALLEFVNTDRALLAQREAMQSPHFSMGLRYEGLRMRKAMLGDPQSVKMMAETRAMLGFTPRDDMPPALVPDPDMANLKPAKAPQMRKLIDAAFKGMFAPEKRKLPGGSTGYTGVLQGTSVTVWIDYAGMGMQLIYGVSIPDETKRVFVQRLQYENLWGAGRGWDYLTEENAEAGFGLLCELIVEVVTLRNQVAAVIGAAGTTSA
jgi:hypothetical protein